MRTLPSLVVAALALAAAAPARAESKSRPEDERTTSMCVDQEIADRLALKRKRRGAVDRLFVKQHRHEFTVAGGFYPATIRAIEAGGYRADITGGVTDTNVLPEASFVDDWRYEAFEQAMAPIRQLKDMKLEWTEAFDRDRSAGLAPPHETAVDAVPEFEKVVAAYAQVDRTLKQEFTDLPPLLAADCRFCPRRLADVVARHKQIFERAVPLDPASAVEEFLRNMQPSEDWYLND